MVHDSNLRGMGDRNGNVVLCEDPKFNDYASLSKDKIKELAVIIMQARLPKSMEPERKRILNDLKEVYSFKTY